MIMENSTRSRVVSPLIGALIFLGLYLSVIPASSPLQSGPMPLPGAPEADVFAYLAGSPGALLVTAVLQGLSVCGLALVLAGPFGRVGAGAVRVLATAAGAVAVAAMLVTVGLSITLSVNAAGWGPASAVVLRDAAFIAGGVVHVVSLGLFVVLVSRLPGWSRPVRVLALVAGIPAVLSVVSTVAFYASVLLPVGRSLCMVWLVVAAVSVLRGRSLGPTA